MQSLPDLESALQKTISSDTVWTILLKVDTLLPLGSKLQSNKKLSPLLQVNSICLKAVSKEEVI